MKVFSLLFFLCILSMSAENVYPQQKELSLDLRNVTISKVISEIEKTSDYVFLITDEAQLELNKKTSIRANKESIRHILESVLKDTNLGYSVVERQVSIYKDTDSKASEKPVTVTEEIAQQKKSITGRVTDNEGVPIIGANIVEVGTTNGTVTDMDGNFSLSVEEGATIRISYIGYLDQDINTAGRTSFNITLFEDIQALEEVVVVGYGTMRKSDLTGSVVRADIESFRESPNLSVMQYLHGSVPGLSVGTVNQAGQEPDVLIRGQSSLSGELAPLIVVDGVIFRGNIIDLNPNDIESIDILKDASSAAIYGSQASNGVILITTTKSGGIEGKPKFSYTGSYAFQSPVNELKAGGPEHFLKKTEESDLFASRTKESGYLERNPLYDPSTKMKTADEIKAYNQGRYDDWWAQLTNENMYTQNHNLSMSNSTARNNYLISLGYTDQMGYMLNEGFERINARINIDNVITDWLKMGIQSFMTSSDYLGQSANPTHRYFSPFATAHDENGERIQLVGGGTVNPLIQAEADYVDKRLTFFGNIYAEIDLPFVKGLTYKVNFANNYRTTSNYYFRSYASNWQGEGSKEEGIGYDWSADNILSYKNRIGNLHNIDVTLVYGAEKRKYNSTRAVASVFSSHELGYNRLQVGQADLQQAISGAWEEVSLYSMARLFYGFDNKYLVTGTIRRDGFSGFGEANKFGLFPSVAFAWVASEESFLNDVNWLNQLKLRISYGSVGNRTIGRYQTLARVEGGYNYITAAGNPVYTQSISSMASPNLKWETTTGINLGVDFGISQRVYGSIDYYNNNTTNLLYEVDIPGINRFQKFPDNLGKLHNHGLEISITSINIKRSDFEWSTTFNFTRNRNELKELLGFDNDGDGKEDDLISEGLFIGESIDAIYDYKVDGKWQVGEEIPLGFDLGAHKIVDINQDGIINADDKTILGYRLPSYMWSINNSIQYQNWTLKFFINSIQGGKNHYMKEDNIYGLLILNQENHFNNSFPVGIDYWTPENPDAKYQRPNINVSSGLSGTLYSQRNFIRLQDISLSYNVPKSLIKKLQINNLRLYLSGQNLITLTKWDGWDPETGQGIVQNGRPVIKSYTVGINVEF